MKAAETSRSEVYPQSREIPNADPGQKVMLFRWGERLGEGRPGNTWGGTSGRSLPSRLDDHAAPKSAQHRGVVKRRQRLRKRRQPATISSSSSTVVTLRYRRQWSGNSSPTGSPIRVIAPADFAAWGSCWTARCYEAHLPPSRGCASSGIQFGFLPTGEAPRAGLVNSYENVPLAESRPTQPPHWMPQLVTTQADMLMAASPRSVSPPKHPMTHGSSGLEPQFSDRQTKPS